jgi:hypothetical protein
MNSDTSSSTDHLHPDSADNYEGWHKRWIGPSRVLEAADQVPSHVLCRKCLTYIDRDTDFFPSIILLLFCIFAAYGLWSLPRWKLPHYVSLGGTLGTALGLLLLVEILPQFRRLSAEGDLLKKLLSTFRWMESEHENWRLPVYRRKACRKMEGIARYIDRMPRAVTGSDGQSRSLVLLRASGVATSLRDLKQYVLMPDIDAWEVIQKEFIGRLDILLETGWWNWPEHAPGDLDRKQMIRNKRWRTIVGFLVAIALAALGIWLATLPKPVGVIAASFALSTAVATLSRSGLELASLKDVTDLVETESNSPKS